MLYNAGNRQTSPCGISSKRWRKVASRAAFSAPIGLDRSLQINAASTLAELLQMLGQSPI